MRQYGCGTGSTERNCTVNEVRIPLLSVTPMGRDSSFLSGDFEPAIDNMELPSKTCQSLRPLAVGLPEISPSDLELWLYVQGMEGASQLPESDVWHMRHLPQGLYNLHPSFAAHTLSVYIYMCIYLFISLSLSFPRSLSLSFSRLHAIRPYNFLCLSFGCSSNKPIMHNILRAIKV